MPIETTRIVAVLPLIKGYKRRVSEERHMFRTRYAFVLASGEEVVTYDERLAERAGRCCAEAREVDVVLTPRKKLPSLLVGLTPFYRDDEERVF